MSRLTEGHIGWLNVSGLITGADTLDDGESLSGVQMGINCKLFRLSTYREHEVTGSMPVRRVSFVRYRSGDNGGRQLNYSLTLGLRTWHLKLRLGRGTWRAHA